MTAAIDDLLERKPHSAPCRPTGDIGQGQRGGSSEPFSLLGMLKERTLVSRSRRSLAPTASKPPSVPTRRKQGRRNTATCDRLTRMAIAVRAI